MDMTTGVPSTVSLRVPPDARHTHSFMLCYEADDDAISGLFFEGLQSPRLNIPVQQEDEKAALTLDIT